MSRSEVPRHATPPKKCSGPGCPKTYTPHEWGSKAAQRAGWFLQRNGDAWCPDHHPEWVAAWRARQSTQPVVGGVVTKSAQDSAS